MKEKELLRWSDYIWLTGLPILLNFIACNWAMPYLSSNTALPIEVVYFLSVGGIVLAPMFFGAVYLCRKEIILGSRAALLNRMRIYKLSRRDWIWTAAVFLLLCLSSFLIAKLLMPKLGFDATPFFFKNMPLDQSNFWILYVWPLFFFFNIFGEELWWRAYLLPRQELLHRNWAWFFNGIFWAAWHIPLGFDLIFASLPIFFILPAVAQYRKNSSIAIVVHAVFGAFGFLAIALGAVH